MLMPETGTGKLRDTKAPGRLAAAESEGGTVTKAKIILSEPLFFSKSCCPGIAQRAAGWYSVVE